MGSSQLDVSFSGLERYMDESPRSSRVSEKLRYWEPLWLYLYRFCRQRCTVYSFVLYSTVLYSVIILGSWKVDLILLPSGSESATLPLG